VQGNGPFGMGNFNGQIYITYLLQHAKKNDVAGSGNAYIKAFDTSGDFIRPLISGH
jgi:hypothetical protein